MCLKFLSLSTFCFISLLSTSCITSQKDSVEPVKGELTCIPAKAGNEIVQLCVITDRTVCVLSSKGTACFTETSAKGGSI